MSLANAFASRTRRRDPALSSLNPQAAAETMFGSSSAAGGIGLALGGMMRMSNGGTGKRKEREDLIGIDSEEPGSDHKRARAEQGEEGSPAGAPQGNGLDGQNDDGRARSSSSSTSEQHGLALGGIEDYNLPLDGLGPYGDRIDALELQRFLSSTGTSPGPDQPAGLPHAVDEDDDGTGSASEAVPPPPPPAVEVGAEITSPRLEASSPAAFEHVASDDEDDDDDAPPPPALLDHSNLPELPNLANLPDLPDLQVSAIPGSLDTSLQANGPNQFGADDPSLPGRAASQDQVEMIRQIFNINPAEELDIMATHENSPAPHGYGDLPIDPSLPESISVNGGSPVGLNLGLAPPAPAKSKYKKTKAKTKKEKMLEQELADEYQLALEQQQQGQPDQALWVDPAPAPGGSSLDNSLSPGAYSRDVSQEPVASGSGSHGKPQKSSKPKSHKGGPRSRNPIVRVVNDRAPTPRNPNGSAPGASDFAPPDGGLTAREAASLFRGDEDHAHPCPHVNCDKAFTRKSDFLRHYRIHTGERPFVCSHAYCGKSFIQRSALTVHERVHSGEKPHTCEDCQRQFSDSSSLARHRRIHQGLKPFKCEMCGTKSFSRRATLTRHQNICPGRAEGYVSPVKRGPSKPGRKGKAAKMQFTDEGDIPPPPGHHHYRFGSDFADSMSPGATHSPEPDLSAQLGGGGRGAHGEDEWDEDEDAEGEDEDADYEEIKVDDNHLPPIPSLSMSARPSPLGLDSLGLPDAGGSVAALGGSTSPRGSASSGRREPAVEGKGGTSAPTTTKPNLKGKQRELRNVNRLDGDDNDDVDKDADGVEDDGDGAAEREAAAVAAAARALDLTHAIDPSLGLEDGEDPSIPEEQAAAVAALVEGFISPHIKIENLE